MFLQNFRQMYEIVPHRKERDSLVLIDLPRDTVWTWVSIVAILRAGCAFTNTKPSTTVNADFLHRLHTTNAICLITTKELFQQRNLGSEFPEDSCKIM